MKRTLLSIVLLIAILAGPIWGAGVQAQNGPNGRLFFPVTVRATTVSGQVVDGANKGVANVAIVDSYGRQTLTDASGRYSLEATNGLLGLAASANGYAFLPSVATLQVKGKTTQNFVATKADAELIANGGFEAEAAWEIPNTAFPASYSSEFVHTGARSALLGITNWDPDPVMNPESYSSFRQTISVPAGAGTTTLRLWLFPRVVSGHAAPEAGDMADQFESLNGQDVADALNFPMATDAGDAQYVMILDTADNVISTLLWTRSNTRTWTLHSFNLSQYAGATIQIEIGVYNDGADVATSLWADDVSVVHTPAVTNPPAGACSLGNGGFEDYSAWSIKQTAFPAAYASLPGDPVHSGSRSMRTGILSSQAHRNTWSYSDVQQVLSIPSTAVDPKLSFWYWPESSQAGAANSALASAQAALKPPETMEEFLTAASAGDFQYLLIWWWEGGKQVIHFPLWVTENTQTWTYREVNLAPFKGRTVFVQFGTLNDGIGGVSAMFVDDVVSDTCLTGTPTPTPAPTPTPVPGACAELFGNNGFETNTSWFIPVTNFSAGYSTTRFLAGARSMRSGIEFAAHNRYSYSDFRQTVAIPAGVSSAELTVNLFTMTGEGANGNDRQYLLILDRWGNWINTLVWQRTNNQVWQEKTFELKGYAGQTIMLQFGVYNDGANGITTMFVDEAYLQACP